MGTNYYVRMNKCESCGRYDEIHIGKQSAGWRFLVHIQEQYYKSLKELFDFLSKQDVELYDEYDEKIDVGEFKVKIESNKDKASMFNEYPECRYACDEFADLHIDSEFS